MSEVQDSSKSTLGDTIKQLLADGSLKATPELENMIITSQQESEKKEEKDNEEAARNAAHAQTLIKIRREIRALQAQKTDLEDSLVDLKLDEDELPEDLQQALKKLEDERHDKISNIEDPSEEELEEIKKEFDSKRETQIELFEADIWVRIYDKKEVVQRQINTIKEQISAFRDAEQQLRANPDVTREFEKLQAKANLAELGRRKVATKQQLDDLVEEGRGLYRKINNCKDMEERSKLQNRDVKLHERKRKLQRDLRHISRRMHQNTLQLAGVPKCPLCGTRRKEEEMASVSVTELRTPQGIHIFRMSSQYLLREGGNLVVVGEKELQVCKKHLRETFTDRLIQDGHENPMCMHCGGECPHFAVLRDNKRKRLFYEPDADGRVTARKWARVPNPGEEINFVEDAYDPNREGLVCLPQYLSMERQSRELQCESCSKWFKFLLDTHGQKDNNGRFQQIRRPKDDSDWKPPTGLKCSRCVSIERRQNKS